MMKHTYDEPSGIHRRHGTASCGRWIKDPPSAAVVAFGLALMAPACSEEMPVDDSESRGEPAVVASETRAEALLSATVTTARPEIFMLTSPGTCTATLILPNWFITAAHCFNYTSSDNLAAGVGSATIGPTTYGVREVYALDGMLGLYDIAIGRLDGNVPASVATPARIATRAATSGEAVVQFGYGCTTRTGTWDGGTKRYAEFTWGTSNRICPGDSGGPVRLGKRDDGGDIVGINSAFGSSDVFGIPQTQVERIWAIIRSRSLGMEPGVDRPGPILSQTVITGNNAMFQCKARCDQDARCRAFTYRTDTQTCTLTTSAGRPTIAANRYSGVPSGAGVGDRPGNTFVTSSATSVEDCESQCATWPSPINNAGTRCVSYTYDNGNCWLKTAAGTVSTACTTCRNGVRHSIESNVDRPGGDYRNFIPTYASVNFCQFECQLDKRCRAFSFVASTGRCYLKDSVPAPVASSGITSAVRRGLEIDVDRPGSDFSNFALSEPDPFACQAECDLDPECRAWTYVPPIPDLTPNAAGITFNNPVKKKAWCWLKNSVPAGSSVLGVISGRAGTAFF